MPQGSDPDECEMKTVYVSFSFFFLSFHFPFYLLQSFLGLFSSFSQNSDPHTLSLLRLTCFLFSGLFLSPFPFLFCPFHSQRSNQQVRKDQGRRSLYVCHGPVHHYWDLEGWLSRFLQCGCGVARQVPEAKWVLKNSQSITNGID